MSTVQIEQDLALCIEKFPNLICRPLGAQFLPDGGIAIMEFAHTDDGIRVAGERHYQLLRKDDLSNSDLDLYRSMDASL